MKLAWRNYEKRRNAAFFMEGNGMIILKLHSAVKGNPITLYLSTNFSVSTYNNETRVMDGVHNNGGWLVRETQQEIQFEVEQWLAELSEANGG